MTQYAPSKLQLQAFKILGEARASENSNSQTIMICNALEALWYSALPIDRLIRIGTAIGGLRELQDHRREAFQREATRLVRAKVLRSRRDRGVTLYEINFQ
jgi:hypothetical protein